MKAVFIVIRGPIASGKSTVARALAQEFERRGARVAVIDLDVVYEMLEHNTAGKGDEEKWLRARRAASALANTFSIEGVDVVIVEDVVLPPQDPGALLGSLQTSARPRFVTLRVSFDAALRRVRKDPRRTVSRDAVFLRRHYQAAEEALRDSPATDLLVDTEFITAEEAARTIADWARASTEAS